MTQKLFFLLFLIGLFSCSKNDIRHDLQNDPTVQITATSKNIHFSTQQMAAISMNGAPTKNDGTQRIAVFPLVIDDQPSNPYFGGLHFNKGTRMGSRWV